MTSVVRKKYYIIKLFLVIPLIRCLKDTVKNIKPHTHAGILLQNTLLNVAARCLGSQEKYSR